MNVLISNDDGYLAEGIAILARVASEFANVRVVAPERDRSGVSNSLTLDRPLQLKQAQNGFCYVNGTPTDCIHVGQFALPDFKPDVVFSGINRGANMGDDTLYSGTVAAATEAYLMGMPAVAFSLNDASGRYGQPQKRHCGHCWRIFLKNRRPRLSCGMSTSLLSHRKMSGESRLPVWADGIMSRTSSRPAIRAANRFIG